MLLLCIVLATLVAEGEGISSWGGVHGKKRNYVPGPTTDPFPNRFLCPLCKGNLKKVSASASTEKSRKSLEDISNLEKNDPDTINIHCAKGEKGDKGDVGGKRVPEWIYKQQIEAAVKPLRAKLEALQSSYTIEIARLRNEVRSIKSKFVHSIGSKENPAKSCKEIYEQEKYSPSGAYYLNITGVATKIYCFMEKGETCPAGSTLVLKIDGTKDTFKYSSPLWSNRETYQEENGAALLDSEETKLPSYWSVPFTRVCINMRKLDSLNMESLVIDVASTSLYDILADGKYHGTKGGRDIWETILPGSRLPNGCFREGFNAHGKRDGSAGARIGVIVSSDQSDCTSADSFLGFGTEGGACASNRQISCGNDSGACKQDTDQPIPAFGYIFVH